MAFKNCCGGGGSITVNGTDQINIQILCDVNGSISTPFIRFYETDPATNITIVISNLDFNGANYVSTGVVGNCSSDDFEVSSEILCDELAGNFTTFIRYTYVDATGAITNSIDLDFSGALYVVTGTVGDCPNYNIQQTILCDDTLSNSEAIVQFIRHTVYDRDSSVSTVYDTELDMTTSYIVLGIVQDCSERQETQQIFSEELSGIGIFNIQTNTKSLSYLVVTSGDSAISPVLTTNSGARNLLAGTNESFNSETGVISGVFQIQTFHENDLIYINYMTK